MNLLSRMILLLSYVHAVIPAERLITGKIEKEYSSHSTAMKLLG